MTRIFYAYLVTNTKTGKRYVGITSRSPARRWTEHVYDARNLRHGGALGAAIRKYGRDEFVVEAIACSLTLTDIHALESTLIAQWGTRAPNGYNLSFGGEGAPGYKHSANAVERSASKHRGTPCHPNTIAAAKLTHLGKPKSLEHREKIAAAKRGVPKSAKTKAKMSAYWAARRAAGDFKTSRPYEHSKGGGG